MIVATRSASAAAICQSGTWTTETRASIRTGLKNGTSDMPTTQAAFGVSMAGVSTMIGMMMRITMGIITCCTSCSLLSMAPPLANSPA